MVPLSITGICKNLPSCIICNASRIVVSNVAQPEDFIMNTVSVQATGQLRQWEKEKCKYNGIPWEIFYDTTRHKYIFWAAQHNHTPLTVSKGIVDNNVLLILNAYVKIPCNGFPVATTTELTRNSRIFCAATHTGSVGETIATLEDSIVSSMSFLLLTIERK